MIPLLVLERVEEEEDQREVDGVDEHLPLTSE